MTAARTVGDILAENPQWEGEGNDRAVVGGNGPPEMTPLEQHREAIDTLYLEAGNWLDGTPIANQAQADEVTKLRDGIKRAGKAADTQRAAEKKPHDDAGKAVQGAWKPLIDKAVKAEQAAGTALSAWLIAEQARAQAAAAELTRLAKEAEDKAREQHQAAARSGDLAALEAADAGIDNAAFFAREAKAAERFKPQAKVEGMARAATLRTVYDVALSQDQHAERDLLRWAYATHGPELVQFALDAAQKAVRHKGGAIPGCIVTNHQTI